MEFRTHLRHCLRQASPDLRVRGVPSWVHGIAVAAVLFGGAAEARAGGTPVGTIISASASVSYSHSNGATGSEVSPDVMVMVGQAAGVDVETPLSGLAPSGTSILFPHTITNVGNGPDTFVLTATSLDGWPIRMVLDVNGDGTEDAGDTPIVGPLALIADASAQILVVLDIPAGIPAVASRAAVTLAATSQFDTGAADSLTDDLEVTPSAPTLVLRKTVNAASAVAGDILTYTITYEAFSLGSNDLTVGDTIPAGLSYEAGTLRLGTRALTDVSGDDEGYHDQTAGVIVVTVPAADIQPEDSVSFQVRVLPVRTTTMMQNVAVASAGPTVGASNVSETLIAGPDLILEKTVQGPNPASSGDELVYRILLTNDNNAGLAPDAVLTDTVPAGLEIVDAGPGATVDGNVVTWALGDVNPSDQVEALLQVRVAGAIPDTLAVVNVANLSLSGEPHMTTSAPSVLLLGTPGDILALDLQGETLEAQLGEPVYLSFTVENRSDMTVNDVAVVVAMPSGLAWSRSLDAVDSIQIQPGQVTLYMGSLAPSGTLEGRAAFALVSALPGNMVIPAMAYGHVDAAAMSSPAPVAALISGAAPAGAAAAPPQGAAPTETADRTAASKACRECRSGPKPGTWPPPTAKGSCRSGT